MSDEISYEAVEVWFSQDPQLWVRSIGRAQWAAAPLA
jgi:hypothetical protein